MPLAAAAGWGLLVGAGALLGAALGCWRPPSPRALATVMALGTGVLLGAIGFELVPQGYRLAGLARATGAFLAGAAAFTVADAVVDRLGGRHRKRSRHAPGPGRRAALAIYVGTLLDGIPEAFAVGADAALHRAPDAALLAALLLSNLPEGLASATGLRRAGYPAARVLALWLAVLVATAAGAAAGHALGHRAPPAATGALLAFTAGAVLAMAADTMIPEAYAEGGRVAGLAAAVGLVASWLLGR